MTGDRVPRCPLTRGLIDRVVDDAARPDDRAHAATCPTCGPVLARAARFDDELRRTARGLVVEELPRDILDPGLSGPRVTARRAGPGLAGIFAAVAIMLVAMSVAFLPGGFIGPSSEPTDRPLTTPPGPSGPAATPADTGLQLEGPTLLPTAVIGGTLIRNDWSCRSGRPRESAATSGGVDHEGIVCTSPKSMLLTSTVLITGVTIDNEVVEVAIKGETVVDTETAASELATSMSKAAFVSVGDKDRAPAVGDWVLTRMPELKVLPDGDSTVGIFGALRLTLQRSSDGSYFLLMQAMPRG